MTPKIGEEQLGRRAVVYIRQSSPVQVTHNQESQRRQYDLTKRARDVGFENVEVIDDDLGRSGSGASERPGFQRLVSAVCAGEVGAVLCIEASRLARNGRDWHHLVDFCGLVGTVLIDPEGVYDPRLPNDRLLLGLKGTMSEFELTLFRQRSLEALRAKASRGELQFCLPPGLCWNEAGQIELDPDRRVQESIRLIFQKFHEFGSIRQVLLWMRQQELTVPTASYGDRDRQVEWRAPVYNTVHSVITNPMYAGAYAYGRTTSRTRIEHEQARKTRGHAKPVDEWTVLLKDHHPGYISWAQYERNQRIVADNAHMKVRMAPKSGRGGRALLTGTLRCARCGRMLHVTYTGLGGRTIRYSCRGANLNHGGGKCIAFGGLRIDEAVARAVVDAVSPHAVEAAMEAAVQRVRRHDEQQRAMSFELEQAQYEARLAHRRYERVDPDNRLVAAELEARWNAAMSRVDEVQTRSQELETTRPREPEVNRDTLLALADSLTEVWNSEHADMRTKQRIVRLLVHEVIADVDDALNEVVLVIHWVGGRHTEIRVAKNPKGHHRRQASRKATDIIKRMAGRWPDAQIAATLNRLGTRTGRGKTWTEMRVYSVRRRLDLPAYDSQQSPDQATVTLTEAARQLGVSNSFVRGLIQHGILPGVQPVPCAPYEIPSEALKSEQVERAVHRRDRSARTQHEQAIERRMLRLPLDSD